MFFDGVYSVFEYSGKKVLDVGGFIGDSTTYFIANGAREVVIVEPLLHEFVRRNIEHNNFRNVVVLPFAFTRTKGKITLRKVGDAFSGASMYREGGEPTTVETITPEEIFAKYGEFDIAKLDCEGCEYEVLFDVLDHVKEGVVLEFHHPTFKFKRKMKKMLDQIKSNGMEVIIIENRGDRSIVKISKNKR